MSQDEELLFQDYVKTERNCESASIGPLYHPILGRLIRPKVKAAEDAIDKCMICKSVIFRTLILILETSLLKWDKYGFDICFTFGVHIGVVVRNVWRWEGYFTPISRNLPKELYITNFLSANILLLLLHFIFHCHVAIDLKIENFLHSISFLITPVAKNTLCCVRTLSEARLFSILEHCLPHICQVFHSHHSCCR